MKAYQREYYQKHKKEICSKKKAYYQKHKEDKKAYNKSYRESHKDYYNDYSKKYSKDDVNSFGKTKDSIRHKSKYYLKKHGTKIPGYQIHHCFTYDEPYKFIYCSKEKHLEIHQYLRDNNINADTNHYEQIKHLLDDTVFVYGV